MQIIQMDIVFQCDHLCGDGKQSRDVQCYIKNDGKIEVLEESECEAIETKPESEKVCNVRPCEGVDWITSEWSGVRMNAFRCNNYIISICIYFITLYSFESSLKVT